MDSSLKGIASLASLLLIIAATLLVGSSVATLTFITQGIIQTSISSMQSYYAAQAGIEDAAYRIKNAISYPSTYTLPVGTSQASITATSSGASRIVNSQGENQSNVRELQATLTLSTQNIQFFFGVQVGEGGLTMGNGSSVLGNVFSNGNIQGGGATQSTITGSAQVASTHFIKDIRVNENATAASFDNCSIGQQASYVTSFTNCTAASTQVLTQTLSPQDFPITQAQIDTWKAEAMQGGELSGFNLGNNSSDTLGPKKINGNITLGNSATLTLTGTVWVTGTINFGNTDTIQLDPGYAETSGVLVVDGAVDVGNTAVFTGSGEPTSYLMLISLFGPSDAIDIGNNATGAIFYAPNGVIDIGNNLNLREATGYGLEIGNESSITYETGLANAQFSSGPGGSFEITEWKEVE